jgi:phytoene dehydrogenase-like protein
MADDMARRPHHDAVVIGAGPNGLSAAVVLARAGRSVLVLEGRDSVGGAARSAALTLPDYMHDICSAVFPLAAGSPCFQSMPLANHGLEWLHPPAPLAHPMDDGGAAVLDRSIDETAATCGDARDAAAYRALAEPFAGEWAALADELLRPLLHVPRSPGLLIRFGLHAVRSAASFRHSFRSPRMQALIAGLAGHSTLPLTKAGSAAFALVLAVAGHAVGWPIARGGAQRISDALSSYLQSLGGEIETGRMIARFDQLPPARAYLFDVAPPHLGRICGDELPARYRRALERYRYGMGIFKVDWALHEAAPWRADICRTAGTLHLGGTLAEIERSERDAWEGRISDRPFVLFSQPTIIDPSRAPADRHVAWAYCHVPHGSAVDMTDRIESQVERFAPGFRDCILARHTINAGELEAHNPNCVAGDISGGVPDIAQLLFRPVMRATPYATPNPRIFLCSSSTPPGGGVHGMCGWHAAQAALRRVLS